MRAGRRRRVGVGAAAEDVARELRDGPALRGRCARLADGAGARRRTAAADGVGGRHRGQQRGRLDRRLRADDLARVAGAEHRVEGQLGGLPDGLGGGGGVLHAGQLDDDPVLAGARQRRLRDAERVDATAQHLERPVGRLGVGLRRRGVLGLAG